MAGGQIDDEVAHKTRPLLSKAHLVWLWKMISYNIKKNPACKSASSPIKEPSLS
ncbi:putative exocyst complex component 6B-like [Sesbania bispinosa]|nr:putative exocyst complex component 6B-like [Sesbania bispinosa]